MIDFSTLKELYVDGKKVTSLFLDGHEVPFGEEAPKYLMFTAIDAPLNVELRQKGTPSYTPSLVYSTDNGSTWSDYTIGVGISVSTAGSNIMFKAKTTNAGFSTSNNDYYAFAVNEVWGQESNKCKVSGNIMSLLDTTSNTVPSYAFYNLFSANNSMIHESIADASELVLPAETLADNCYSRMFWHCVSLSSAPALPATTLANYCYNYMFYNCSSLSSAPALPATTLADSCYNAMFQGCTSLSSAPALPATTLATNCYNSMFRGCTSLATAPALPATTLASGCYYGMFRGCTSLATAPALPATTLANGCYNQMFNGSSNINYIKTNQTSFTGCQSWVQGVASSGTFICPAVLGTDTTIRRGVSYCPTGWTVVNYDAT